jgi:NAD(P)-dependent dehydrogenase (short-subunit alcohol dehydrogenase family)
MEGKVVMVTGGNAGIGRETMRELAKTGAQLVMVCRDPGRGTAACRDIELSAGSASLEMMVADLSSQAQIRKLAKDFKSNYDHLDVLVNNAAIIPRRRQVTDDGIELQLAVNHLAPFLLSHLLLDVLIASVPSRIINVSSGTHPRGRIDFDDLQAERGYKGFKRYSATKLANILFTRALARRLEGTGVTVNAMTPGFIHSGLGRDFSLASRGVVRMIAGKPEDGGRRIAHLVSSPELETVTGKYFKHTTMAEPSDTAMDDAIAERLWVESERLVNLAPEEKHFPS